MLRVALADDASHAVAFHDFAMLADRLHACANFHLATPDDSERKKLRPDLNSNRHPKFKQGDGLRKPTSSCQTDVRPPHPQGAASSARTEFIAARRSGAAVTIRPTTMYRAPDAAASTGVTTRA